MTDRTATTTTTTEVENDEPVSPSPSPLQPPPPPQPPRIHLILTAFGPFGGVPDNPSMALLRELPQFLSSSSSSWKARVQERIVETLVVETSAHGARQAIHHIQQTIHSNSRNVPSLSSLSSSPPPSPPIPILCLHVGVNASAQRGEFQIETCAYNDATFRIPDEQAYRPYREPILSHVEWGTPIYTTLLLPTSSSSSPTTTSSHPVMMMVDDLIHQLSQAFPALDSRVSTDPGRFVCNYLYYLSLNQWQSSPSLPASPAAPLESTTITNNNDPTMAGASLFLHIPPFEQVPKDIQLEYLAEMMRILCRVEL
jgi:pyroglutamyl-peptidase